MTNDELRDAISGERRSWHRVEVRPDDLAALLDELARFRALLSEAVEEGDWTHEHCDEDSGGNHRFDHDAWEFDVRLALAEAKS